MKVSFGKIKLTPKDLIGKSLAGYTPIPKCTGKYDDIYARGILIEETVLGNVKKRLLLISMDYLKLPLLFSEYIKEKIEEKYYIHPNQVLLHATHTHKSVDLSGEFVRSGGIPTLFMNIMTGGYYCDSKYNVWATYQVVKMVGELIENLQPAKIGWKKEVVQEHMTINRRHPSRRTKSSMGIISFRNLESNKMIGFLANYGTHPTSLNNTIDKLSADYPGRLINKVEELTNNEIEAAFFTAPAGDLNPITTCGTDFDNLENNKSPIYGQTGDYEHTTKIGNYLGERALKVANSIPDEDYYEHLDFKSHFKTFWIPLKDYDKYWTENWIRNKLIHFIKKYLLFNIPLILGDAEEPNFPGFAIKHRGKQINAYSEIQYITFSASSGDKSKSKNFAISGIPGELFEDIAKKLYENTPTGEENTFIFQNANDWVGYLFPLGEYISQSGYEPLASFSPLAGAYVQNTYIRLLKEIEENIEGGHY
ncbi:MAG: hypothetical protein GY870_01150 [archaeon]|nr:hypothetical protein [archaeon]